MSTTTLTPLDTLKGRLAAAKAERLEPAHLAIREGTHWSITEQWATVPSSGGDEDYTVIIVDEPGQPIRCSCDCKAGEFAKACKHIALVLDAFGMVSDLHDYEMLKPEDIAPFLETHSMNGDSIA